MTDLCHYLGTPNDCPKFYHKRFLPSINYNRKKKYNNYLMVLCQLIMLKCSQILF